VRVSLFRERCEDSPIIFLPAANFCSAAASKDRNFAILEGNQETGMWELIQTQLQQNQVFSGGLLLMAGGALLAYFRGVPGLCYQWLRRQWITEIDILDRDPAFEWVEKWMSEHAYSRHRARSLTVKTVAVDYEERRENPTLDPRPRIVFSPAPGWHWLFYRGRLVCLHRERPKLNENNSQPILSRESWNITIYSRDRGLARQLLEEAREAALPANESRLTVHRAGYACWNEQMKRMPRPLESVVLPAGMMEEMLADLRLFLGRRSWYRDRGIPYRRGYLLHGPPGTGKSSAVVALASALGMDISMLSLGNANLDDNSLADLLSEVPINSLVLMEDIDCAFIERQEDADKRSKVTFSGLLNAIDGVAAGEGRLLFATTNHLERLDPALIRPGRIDRKFYIGLADQEQVGRMFRRFFPDATAELVQAFASRLPPGGAPMSMVQTHLLQHAEDPQQAVATFGESLRELTHRSSLPLPSEPRWLHDQSPLQVGGAPGYAIEC
jgi:chaperone BCS1